MPPALHPRSTYTTSLFGLTLAISFLVVGVPHILPCPVDPRQYADAPRGPDGRVMVQRRRRNAAAQDTAVGDGAPVNAIRGGGDQAGAEDKEGDRVPRECPVPKPRGVIGRMLGFEGREETRTVRVLEGRRREG